MNTKRVSDSLTEQVQIVFYPHTNSSGRLFGGQLMQWIDTVAAVVGRRHSGREVITASVDQLSFLAPVCVGDTVVLKGRIVHAGKTSMNIRVDTFSESCGGERALVNRAYLVIVALDGDGRPCKVPALELLTDEERTEWAAAESRRAQRMAPVG